MRQSGPRTQDSDRAPAAGSYVVRGKRLDAPRLAPGLYLVATPIGNLADVTLRALDILAAADLIACEDTRVSRKLLDRYAIQRPLVSYHEHSGPEARRRIIDALAAGGRVALISDAGTPLVSDPGYRLVEEALAAGLAVVPVPGPSSVLAALTASGLPTDAFLFAGFLPARSAARRRRLEELREVPASLVVMESPRRLAAMLADAAEALGPQRPAAVCRELTKLHETVARDSLGQLADRFAHEPVRGEVVVVVGPPSEARAEMPESEVDRRLGAALATSSVRDAADRVAAETGRPRRAVYRRALALKETKG